MFSVLGKEYLVCTGLTKCLVQTRLIANVTGKLMSQLMSCTVRLKKVVQIYNLHEYVTALGSETEPEAIFERNVILSA